MMVGIAKRKLADEDWKTHVAQDKEWIPTGAKVEIVSKIKNFYGTYYLCNYKGKNYYLNPRDLKLEEVCFD